MLQKGLLHLGAKGDGALDNRRQGQGLVADQRSAHRDELADAPIDLRIVHECAQPDLGIRHGGARPQELRLALRLCAAGAAEEEDIGIEAGAPGELIDDPARSLRHARPLQIGGARKIERPIGPRHFEQVAFNLPAELRAAHVGIEAGDLVHAARVFDARVPEQRLDNADEGPYPRLLSWNELVAVGGKIREPLPDGKVRAGFGAPAQPHVYGAVACEEARIAVRDGKAAGRVVDVLGAALGIGAQRVSALHFGFQRVPDRGKVAEGAHLRRVEHCAVIGEGKAHPQRFADVPAD